MIVWSVRRRRVKRAPRSPELANAERRLTPRPERRGTRRQVRARAIGESINAAR